MDAVVSVRHAPVRASRDSAPHGATTNRAPRRVLISTLLAFASVLVISGCRREAPVEAPPPAPPPLARVGAAVITAEDVVAEAQRLRAAGQPDSDPQAVLQGLVLRAAMLQEAATSAWVETREARRERENLLLSQWLEHTVQAEKEKVAISDDELRAGYEANVAEFTRPAMARLAILYRKPSARSADASEEALSAELLKARQAYLDDPVKATREGRIPGFGAVAAEASEHATSRYRGGDIGWLDISRQDHPVPAEVAAAGFALPVGGVSEVLSTESGLYIVMKQDQRDARTAPFDEVAATLRRRLLRERREAIDAAFKSNVLQRADVAIDARQAAALTLPEAPARQTEPPALIPLNRLRPAIDQNAPAAVEPGKEASK